MERLKDLAEFEEKVELEKDEATITEAEAEKAFFAQIDGVKMEMTRNEPKVVFDECSFETGEKDGKKVVKCTVTSHVIMPKMHLRMSEERVRHEGNLAASPIFPYPTSKIVTTGTATCDPRDTYNENTGKRISRVKAEKRAFAYHRKALVSCFSKFLTVSMDGIETFVEKAEKVLSDPIIYE